MSAPESMSEEDENTIVIPIDRSFSDGDPAIWPKDPKYKLCNDSTYREKLAVLWLKKMGAYEEGMNYSLDKLPEGYALLERPRIVNPDIYDRFLYGHPVGQYFQSTIQFFPHFYYLMTGGATPCKCALCERLQKQKARREAGMPLRGGRLPGPNSSRGSGTSSRGSSLASRGSGVASRGSGIASRGSGIASRGKPVARAGRIVRQPIRPVVDGEGQIDVYKLAIMELKENGRLDKKIKEKTSMDWRAERERLREYLEKLDLQPSYIPRAGEIVLWTRELNGELLWNSENYRVEIYSAEENRWLGMPEWRAGIVGQVPEDNIVLQDLVETTPKEKAVNYSGFRIETFPDPNSSDKSYSLHSKYVPLRCIKPFNSFELFVQGMPRKELHPSIENALTVMSSFSLLDKYHVKGTWPNASIYCRGIFIGAELLIIGDAVRLKPKGYNPNSLQKASVTDVMVIDEIQMELINCEEDVKSSQLAEDYRVRISGKIYTTSSVRAQKEVDVTKLIHGLSEQEISNTFQYTDMGGYGNWYHLYTGKTAKVSHDMILGRCYEPDAMRLLFGSLSMSHDLHGVIMAREYSRQADDRIPEGKQWFWGDFRTQTLAIDSLNGEDVGYYSEARDIKMWRANLKVIDGTACPADYREAKLPGEVGRPSAKSRSSFGEVRKTSSLVSTGLGATTDISNTVSSADEGVAQESSEEEDFTVPIQYLHGGTEETEETEGTEGTEETEETEEGDYVLGKERKAKRSKR
ncbi:hypothetical protein SI65_01588 [Aspergillus cristatus]|uniref:Cryptic loci regulator 2 N-terminal domain-containing protein n=1 Tax=Aspergillus cristatus TaxID=573508 RepID=A0A1E3BSR4_ASPCR|nr:hypothetical protein SI65_01588 [Aspergillus cristatus]